MARPSIRMAFSPGDRVEIAPHFDQWMRGDHYGTVVKQSQRFGVYVKMDKSGKTLRFAPADLTGINPRRRVTKRAQRFIGRTIRRLAHKGERAPRRIAIAYSKARRRGFRVPRANPMSKKDFEYMAALIANAQLQGMSVACVAALTDFAVDLGKRSNPRFDADRFARRILQLVGEKRPFRYVNRNPATLAIIGRNPNGKARAVATLGTVAEIRYHRAIEPGKGKWYKHAYATPMHLTALSDGTLHIWHPRAPAWAREE